MNMSRKSYVRKALGIKTFGLIQIAIRLSPQKFDQLNTEAKKRELSFSAIVAEKLGDKIS